MNDALNLQKQGALRDDQNRVRCVANWFYSLIYVLEILADQVGVIGRGMLAEDLEEFRRIGDPSVLLN